MALDRRRIWRLLDDLQYGLDPAPLAEALRPVIEAMLDGGEQKIVDRRAKKAAAEIWDDDLAIELRRVLVSNEVVTRSRLDQIVAAPEQLEATLP